MRSADRVTRPRDPVPPRPSGLGPGTPGGTAGGLYVPITSSAALTSRVAFPAGWP
jgi:hypothetical protein